MMRNHYIRTSTEQRRRSSLMATSDQLQHIAPFSEQRRSSGCIALEGNDLGEFHSRLSAQPSSLGPPGLSPGASSHLSVPHDVIKGRGVRRRSFDAGERRLKSQNSETINELDAQNMDINNKNLIIVLIGLFILIALVIGVSYVVKGKV